MLVLTLVVAVLPLLARTSPTETADVELPSGILFGDEPDEKASTLLEIIEEDGVTAGEGLGEKALARAPADPSGISGLVNAVAGTSAATQQKGFLGNLLRCVAALLGESTAAVITTASTLPSGGTAAGLHISRQQVEEQLQQHQFQQQQLQQQHLQQLQHQQLQQQQHQQQQLQQQQQKPLETPTLGIIIVVPTQQLPAPVPQGVYSPLVRPKDEVFGSTPFLQRTFGGLGGGPGPVTEPEGGRYYHCDFLPDVMFFLSNEPRMPAFRCVSGRIQALVASEDFRAPYGAHEWIEELDIQLSDDILSQIFPGSFHHVRYSPHRAVHGLEFKSPHLAINGLTVLNAAA